jgi:hypothetical protein
MHVGPAPGTDPGEPAESLDASDERAEVLRGTRLNIIRVDAPLENVHSPTEAGDEQLTILRSLRRLHLAVEEVIQASLTPLTAELSPQTGLKHLQSHSSPSLVAKPGHRHDPGCKPLRRGLQRSLPV